MKTKIPQPPPPPAARRIIDSMNKTDLFIDKILGYTFCSILILGMATFIGSIIYEILGK